MSDQESPEPEPLEELHPPRGARAMAWLRWILVAAMALVAVSSVAYSFGLVGGGSARAASAQYYCPMHPQVVQDHPGECPICGMTLVQKEGSGAVTPQPAAPAKPKPIASAKPKPAADESHEGHRHNPSDPYLCPMHPEETGLDEKARCPICKMKLVKREAAPPATARGVPGLVPVELALERVQLSGIRTAQATREKLASELRTVGYVTADEGKLARVHTRFSGWIEQLPVSTTGQKVQRGQVLAGIYNLELLPAQQEFLAARRWSGAGTASEVAVPLEQDARTRLENLGMSRAEIDAIASTGKPSRTVGVTSPISGYVVAKQAVQGGFVQPGTQLFEIADLSRVWVVADVYEHEIGRVAVGQSAGVELAGQRGQRIEGKLGFIYPALDPGTRTLKVRIELDNKGLQLRPGMYGDVVIRLGEQQGVVVPREALVDTGEHQYVFVAKEAGRFEPRLVEVGARTDDKVQIASGLSEGETVVTTANFLIDSESRLRAAIEGNAAPHTNH